MAVLRRTCTAGTSAVELQQRLQRRGVAAAVGGEDETGGELGGLGPAGAVPADAGAVVGFVAAAVAAGAVYWTAG